MKKIIFVIMCCIFFNNTCFASSKDNCFRLRVKNVSANQIIKQIDSKIDKTELKEYKIDNNIIYYLSSYKFYIKAYPTDSNTDLFVVTTSKDTAEQWQNKINQKSYIMQDKNTNKKYFEEYLSYMKTNGLLNDTKTKNEKYVSYNPYSKSINNKQIDKQSINSNGINITRIEYKPKTKIKHYTNEYEYIINNNTNQDIIISSVASAEFIGLTQVAAYAVIPRGVDFIPVWGMIAAVQTDIEKNKFTRPHPVNETIKANDTMRILALSKKQDNPTADFTFTINNKKTTITFKGGIQ